MFRLSCLVACAATVRALNVEAVTRHRGVPTQPPRAHAGHSVLILGCSLDRYAVEWFCGQRETEMRVACADKSRDIALGYVFHPGVGLYGDLKPPFFNHSRYLIDKDSIITQPEELYKKSQMMVGVKFPDMVVVDSSIWDLSNWAAWQNTKVPEERLQQWCDHDLPNLLTHVSNAFGTKSRIVFRNAPPMSDRDFSDRPWLDNDAVEYMHKCVMANLTQTQNKLFGKYEVIDYYKIVDQMVAETPHAKGESSARYAAHVWQNDGFHPSKIPARLYVNEILKLMNITTLEEGEWNRTALGQMELVPVHVPKKEGEEILRMARGRSSVSIARESVPWVDGDSDLSSLDDL